MDFPVVLFIMLFATFCKVNSSTPSATTGHLTTRNTIADVLVHPAFEGFAQYILPLEWGYDEAMPLSQVARLLPYHNYIDAGRCVGYINQMIDSVAAGRKIYYDLGRRDAGLFFFRGRPGAPFAVICPGGGFSYVGSIHEGFPHALALSQMGYNAFVIQYQVGSAQTACEDLAAGIEYIFRHVTELQVDTAGYSVWGSSAGARMAAYMGSYGPAAFGDRYSRDRPPLSWLTRGTASTPGKTRLPIRWWGATTA